MYLEFRDGNGEVALSDLTENGLVNALYLCDRLRDEIENLLAEANNETPTGS